MILSEMNRRGRYYFEKTQNNQARKYQTRNNKTLRVSKSIWFVIINLWNPSCSNTCERNFVIATQRCVLHSWWYNNQGRIYDDPKEGILRVTGAKFYMMRWNFFYSIDPNKNPLKTFSIFFPERLSANDFWVSVWLHF